MTRRVLVTGAASGIGAATVAELTRLGAQVVGADLVGAGGPLLRCDVRDQGSVDAAVAAAVDRLGGLDALVNSAGIGLPQRASEPPGDDALAVLDVNLLGTWRVTAAALPALRASRGRVVNLASGLALLTVPFAPAYCASKRGVVAFSDALRLEVGHQVSVTTIYPGYVRTPIHDAARRLGIGLEGMVPAESLDAVTARVVRAVLGRPARDLAGTPAATVAYALLRLTPRVVVDRLVTARLRRAARAGLIADSPLAEDLLQQLRG